ncbi:MAG: tRNA pseudouridine(55) synthase, partial [Candidatus Magasanikbacteria bacterium]|nr:tRNA pseudouridine(55) synthase [Candidatus Magasanikbacteria bacterium]
MLGVGGYCEELRRTSIGEYSVEDALDPKMLEKETWNDRLI